MRQFKGEGRRLDFNGTGKAVYEKYKAVLKVNAQQVIKKNAEAWMNLLSLIREKRK